MFELTPDQKNAHDIIIDWFLSDHKLMTLGGYAGTGKTFLTSQIARTLKNMNLRLAFCTVAGKASTVLRAKLGEILKPEDYCGTIHSLIYRLIHKEKLKSGRTELYFSADEEKLLPYDLIIVDEASMMNEWMFRDLSVYGIPILAVGDHGQLPPVKGNFNLMSNPEIKLEKIMRQAENNPIIKIALMAREEGRIAYGNYGPGCLKTADPSVLHKHDWASINSISLCGLNKTRVRMNNFAREKLKRDQFIAPIVGEPIICLYNNNKKLIYNGNIGIILNINISLNSGEEIFEVEVDMGDRIFRNGISPEQFGKEYVSVDDKSEDVDYFDFAYCTTVHKAQGSEWDNVLVLEEGEFLWKGDMWRRWLYTAVTRARERLVIFKR